MNDDLPTFIFGLVLGACMAALMIVMWIPDWQSQAIAHKAAHYDAQTGKFTWNQE